MMMTHEHEIKDMTEAKDRAIEIADRFFSDPGVRAAVCVPMAPKHRKPATFRARARLPQAIEADA